ncbi:MAG: hypothetical protein WCL23_03610 [Candidatus Moraniibacteriota bacterium]
MREMLDELEAGSFEPEPKPKVKVRTRPETATRPKPEPKPEVLRRPELETATRPTPEVSTVSVPETAINPKPGSTSISEGSHFSSLFSEGIPFSSLSFSASELENMRSVMDRSHSVDTVGDVLLGPDSKKELLRDRTRVRAEREVLIRNLTGAVRERVGREELSYLIRPEDAEILHVDSGTLSDEGLNRLFQADRRRAVFVDRLWTATRGFFGDAGKREIYETLFREAYDTLLMESVEPTVRDSFLERKREEERQLKSLEDSSKLPTVNYEFFDPEAEFMRINAFTEKERADLSHEDYMAEKSRRLSMFKERLLEQKKGLAVLHLELEEALLGGGEPFGDEKTARLLEHIHDRAKDLKLSPVQLGRYQAFFDTLEQWKNEMDWIQGDLIPGKDDAELLEVLFGVKPKGTVSIRRGSLSFIVDCQDLRDYARISNESSKRASLSDGFARDFMVVINNKDGKMSDERSKDIVDHEERHVLRSTLDTFLRDSTSYEGLDEEERGGIETFDLKTRIEHVRTASYDRAKDEIFAYLKAGVSSPIEIRDILMQGRSDKGIYDYLEEYRKESCKDVPWYRWLELKRVIGMNRDRYRDVVSEALDVVEKLYFLRYPEQRIVSMLEFEPLEHWDSVVSRYEEAGEFAESRKSAVGFMDTEIEALKGTLDRLRMFGALEPLERNGLGFLIPKTVREKIDKRASTRNTLRVRLEQREQVRAPFRR